MPSKRPLSSSEPQRGGVSGRGGLHALAAEDLLALVETSRELARETHLPRLLHRILEEATRLSDSPDASLLLPDDARGCLYFADALGNAAPMLLQQWGRRGAKGVPLVGSKAGQVFTSMTSVVVDAVLEDPNHFKGVDRATHKLTNSMVCVPLVAVNRATGEPRCLGAIQILNKRSGNYSERDRLLLERFADQAAIAIENARLVRDLYANKGLYTGEEDDIDPQEVLARPAWHETLSTLVADMRGFTQLCQVIGRPERSQAMLNEFLGMLADQVVAHRGVVNKFLGDGVLAFFRDPDHAVDAVACAFDMVHGFDALKTGWDDKHNVKLKFLDLGVGISTEEVILGVVGSGRVWDFTAIGTGVNLASYLMEQAREGKRVLVDKVTFRAARDIIDGFEGPEEFELRKSGQTVAHPYERYTLRTRKGMPPAPELHAPAATGSASSRRSGVFISYSHRDDEWRRLLRTHLHPYVTAGSVEVWDDTAIEAGEDWKSAIDQAIQNAAVALFLVSPNLLASPFVLREEIAPLLAKARAREVKILWLPVVASSYEETEFRALQAAMNPARPLDQLSAPQQHHALVDVCKIIKASTEPRAG